MPNIKEAAHRLSGPCDDNWRFVDVVTESELVWMPCGEERNLSINTQLRVNGGTSDSSKTSFIAMTATDGSPETTYHLTRRPCSSA
ncbi:DUF4360 domain-containing protein [Actinomadura roseirufa]|uniref:DUF4360 domain-containing protein n=1 Tax=Actinomadura roseirufa TaxID=2094049 RepID=UPI003521F51C